VKAAGEKLTRDSVRYAALPVDVLHDSVELWQGDAAAAVAVDLPMSVNSEKMMIVKLQGERRVSCKVWLVWRNRGLNE
jgi:hypothetical protein